MPPTLYIATTNPGKLRDFSAASDPAHTLAPLPGIEAMPVPVEDAPDFAGNARIKATAYSLLAPGLLVLADDSGLEVDALHSAPGVYSARYASRENFPNPQNLNQDAWNNACLMHHLQCSSNQARTARYRCILAAARDGAILAMGNGTVEGRILTAPRGTRGFGYDPLFLLPGLGLTMAELDVTTKLSFSHRGRALRALLAALV